MKNLLWKCFELVINYYQGFIMTWFVYRFLNPKSLKQAKTFLSIFSIIFGTTITLLNHITLYEGFTSTLYLVILLVYAIIAFNDSIIKKLLSTIIPNIILLLITSVELNLLSSLNRISVKDLITNDNSVRFMTLIVIQISLWISLKIIINLSYLVIIILNFLMFYVIYSLFFKNAQIKNMKVLSVKEQYMEQYVNNAETQYELIRKIRHDIKDQLTTVYELLTSGKTEDALEFIEQSNGIVKATMTFVQTNNPVANAIINSKLSTASTLGIKVSCITVNDFVGINELDLCDLLSNTLENAITACEAMPPDLNKFIYLEISKENNIYTFIVKNSLDKSVISENPKLKTTKKDIINHGLGTSIIRDIVNKYSGRYDYYEIDNAFCCSIILET